jgi:23S rRNA pseudouridine2457 synthase
LKRSSTPRRSARSVRPPTRRATGGPRTRTIAFYKPFDVLPSFTDPEGRPTLAGFIDVRGVYAAGRLDRDSEGLMILTSDGALAHRITDPAHKLPKVYLVQVERVPDEEAVARLRAGVVLGDTRTKPGVVRLLHAEPSLPERAVPIRVRKNVPTAWLEVTLQEGMNRQVRRMTAAVGHPTLRLVRVAIGAIRLDGLQPGEWRELHPSELAHLGPAT